MKKVVIFGAATGGKKVASSLLGKAFNGGGGIAKFCFS